MSWLSGHQFAARGDETGEALATQTQGRRLLPLPGLAGAKLFAMQLLGYDTGGSERAGAIRLSHGNGILHGMVCVPVEQRLTQITCRDTQLYCAQGQQSCKRKRAEVHAAPAQTPCSEKMPNKGGLVKRRRRITDEPSTPVSLQYAPLVGCGECATPEAPRALNAAVNPFSWSPVPKQAPASLIQAAERKPCALDKTATFQFLEHHVPFRSQAFPQILAPICSIIPRLGIGQQWDAIANELCDESDAVHTSSPAVISAPAPEDVLSPAHSRATGVFHAEYDDDLNDVQSEPTMHYQDWINDFFWSEYQTTPTSRYVPLTSVCCEPHRDVYGLLSLNSLEEQKLPQQHAAPCNEPFLLPSLRLRTKRVC